MLPRRRFYIPLPKVFIRTRGWATDTDACCDILAVLLKQIGEWW